MAVLSFPFMAKLSVPYAVFTLLSRAMLAARDINLDLSLVMEAIPAITRGAANPFFAPVATILDWPLFDMAKLSCAVSGLLSRAMLTARDMAKLSYAVSTLLSYAMLTARDINLDLSLVAEAIPAITRGAANPFLHLLRYSIGPALTWRSCRRGCRGRKQAEAAAGAAARRRAVAGDGDGNGDGGGSWS
jgi:hypothetical protein